MKLNKAIIFSAGFGKRLTPLTRKTPKPLLKLNNKTLLQNCIIFLENCGIQEIIINVHYLAEQIIEFLNKNKFKSKIYISHERDEILGTGGALNYANKKFKTFFKNSFVTINPDTLWTKKHVEEFKIMKKFHQRDEMVKSILLLVSKKNCFEKNLKGDFSLDYKKGTNINNILKKTNLNNYIYTGLQILRTSDQIKHLINNKKNIYPINHYWNKLIESKCIYGYSSNQKFYHVSNFKTYKKLLNLFPNE